MKKLVAFAAIIAAVSFTSCGNKSAQTEEVAESTEVVVEETPAVVEEAVAVEIAPADSTVTEVPAAE